MSFPPAEENLDVPSEFIGECDLLGCEIVAIGGDPVHKSVHPIADKTDFPFRLIDGGGPQKKGAWRSSSSRSFAPSYLCALISISA